ncbi:hypothetical protein DPMN_000663 [Dreissena polymorpha]|uniref:Uncharacterized protein n=1 Tax=Dreissena polymorpha TaxID=45954 RepID=A0A9D4MH38_DREPO|nr:hypothetical protein DPMN_000663 [Dreissena polymorpha]
MCTCIQFKDNLCLLALRRTRLLRHGSADSQKDFLPAPRSSAQGPPRPSSSLPPPLPRFSSGEILKPLSTNYGQLPFRLAIHPSFGSQRSQRKRTSGSSDDNYQLINRAAHKKRPYPTLLRRRSESTILRTFTIPLGHSSESSRKSTGDNRHGREMHAPAADGALLN